MLEPKDIAAPDPVVSLDEETIIDTSDIALSIRFASRYEGNLRFVGQWSRWWSWTGHRWEMDHKMATWSKAKSLLMGLAKRIYRVELAREMVAIDAMSDILSETDRRKRRKHAKRKALLAAKPIKGQTTVAATINLARSDERLVSAADEWDADPWALNTPTGTIDLKKGTIRKHNPVDLITMRTAAGPLLGKAPRWTEFLKTVMDGDDEMVTYLQRILGYCLTGTTGEQAMFFAFGTGANGKSVILNTIGGILGDYHKSTAMETFILTQDYRHPTELANHRGARIVTASETQKGRRWDEVKVKRLTGGDPISARFMRQDFFEFLPQFKLFITGNHKPTLTSVDEAMRRRFNLIPFTVTVPQARRDPFLVEKFKEEWPQILGWMIEGCLQWQLMRLRPPHAVVEATESYMSMEDSFAAWYEDCCNFNSYGFETIGDLFTSWETWANKAGDRIGTKKEFSQTLLTRSDVLKIKYRKTNQGRGFDGLSLTAGREAA